MGTLQTLGTAIGVYLHVEVSEFDLEVCICVGKRTCKEVFSKVLGLLGPAACIYPGAVGKQSPFHVTAWNGAGPLQCSLLSACCEG